MYSNNAKTSNPLLSVPEADQDLIACVEVFGLRDAAAILDLTPLEVLKTFNAIQERAMKISPMPWVKMVEDICMRPPGGFRSERLVAVLAKLVRDG